MKSMKHSTGNAASPGLSSGSGKGPSAFQSQPVSATNLQTPDGRLEWLDLYTRPHAVRQALITLFTAAMQETSDAKRAGHFLLSLWSPGKYPLDVNELGFFERELNFAVRHLLNFIIAGQVNFRMLVTYSEMAPVIAAWGEE